MDIISMLPIEKTIEYIIEKTRVSEKLFSFISDKMFFKKLIKSQADYYNKHFQRKNWFKTNFGFSVALYLPNRYDKCFDKKPMIYVKSDTQNINLIKIQIIINLNNETRQKTVEFRNIGDKQSSEIIEEIPYRDLIIQNNNISLSFNSIELYLVNEKQTLIQIFTPNITELFNSRYVYYNQYYWNTRFIDNEMEDMFCNDWNNRFDKKIFEILQRKDDHKIEYKLITFLYWIRVFFNIKTTNKKFVEPIVYI